MSRLHRILDALGRVGAAAETTLLVVLLLGMILLSTAQIVLRNFFDIGFFWSDEILRTLVLWIALAGAVAASRTDKHISISLIETFAGERVKRGVKFLTHVFSAAICGLLTWFSLEFALTSREYGDVVLGAVPAWLLQMVLPVGFGLICYRYLLLSVSDLFAVITGKLSGEHG